jgi:ethanolaminephosphotransferase
MAPQPREASHTLDSSSSNGMLQSSSSRFPLRRFFPKHNGFYYLNASAREALPHYQYKGTDNSLLYKYVLSPLAGVCVEHLTPKTIAPNTITLIGLVFMVASYSLFWYYVPSLDISSSSEQAEDEDDNVVPRWIFLVHGLCMLIYQTLDNMDGKQARRTGSSSPLGLLFDHGCDAINSVFGSANWIIGMGLCPSKELFWVWSVVMGPYAMFYTSTWEEYYTGELILPIINGPNEGLVGGAMLSFTSWWVGWEWWSSTTGYDMLASSIIFSPLFQYLPNLRNCDLLLIASNIGFWQEVCLKSISVSRKYGRQALLTMVPMTTLAAGFFIIGRSDPEVFLSLPRTSLNLSMLLFAEMCMQMMLSHITHQRFNPWRWQLLPLIALAAWVGSGHGASSLTDQWLLAYAWSMAAYLAMKISLVIHEVCDVLNIWCFDIVTPRMNKVDDDDDEDLLVVDNNLNRPRRKQE